MESLASYKTAVSSDLIRQTIIVYETPVWSIVEFGGEKNCPLLFPAILKKTQVYHCNTIGVYTLASGKCSICCMAIEKFLSSPID